MAIPAMDVRNASKNVKQNQDDCPLGIYCPYGCHGKIRGKVEFEMALEYADQVAKSIRADHESHGKMLLMILNKLDENIEKLRQRTV